MKINNPASCEVQSVIWFLSAKGDDASIIHCELSEICGPTVMSEGTVCLMKAVQMFMMKKGSEMPSVQTNDLVEQANAQF